MAVIKDVASKAGVSAGTVSKYLKDPDLVKEKNRINIENAIRELDYVPDILARSMRTGKTNLLAIVAPDITNPFFAHVYDSLRTEALREGYSSILYTAKDNPAGSRLKTHILKMTDGVILCFPDEEYEPSSFVDANTNAVNITWDIKDLRYPSVAVDVSEGMHMMTSHLISRGYTKLGYISGRMDSSISKAKFSGFQRALTENHLNFQSGWFSQGDYTLDTGYRCAEKILNRPKKPDALVCANDILALGSLHYTLENGIKVPNELAVSGFDDIAFARMSYPALTSVRIPVSGLARQAVNLILRKGDTDAHIVEPLTIIERSST
jgi:LacI family transcriptional regulator, repressor for deo operon, udp, cdd, tsx, nupC, and nupG